VDADSSDEEQPLGDSASAIVAARAQRNPPGWTGTIHSRRSMESASHTSTWQMVISKMLGRRWVPPRSEISLVSVPSGVHVAQHYDLQAARLASPMYVEPGRNAPSVSFLG
jgi:hypothetical protein